MPSDRRGYGAEWPRIDPGRLRTPIVIQALQASSPPSYTASGLVQSWQPAFSVMGEIEVMRATDLIKAGQDVTKTWITITIRFQDGIDPQMRVAVTDYFSSPPHVHNYAIQAIENVEHRSVLLKLICLGIGAND